MNNHLKKIIQYIGGIGTQIKLWFNEQSKPKQIGIVMAILVFGFIGIKNLADDAQDDSMTVYAPRVKVASVSSLSNNEMDFPLIGTVTSVNEATIRAESNGKLTRVYKKLGDPIYAGGVIAEFENSGERAVVLQSEGAYDQAKASRNLVTISGSINSIQSDQTGTSLVDTKTQGLNTIGSVYTSMDDAVRGKTDGAFRDAEFQDVKFLLTVPDANLVINLENKRREIQAVLKARETK